ncbi:hypothetical protein [Salipiger sp. PrR002]|uniref:hypothetical protein n=1 Tax=Salipiger sp. PrR002 TaxID=2706489 RepID=UPI0013B720FE|nr:hypothetical protein [Salipiger sp. PrR002]NDV98549.1 hypothetical protein [Salipiger sp. PrR002]NDW57384.1 hypothetical protein [Salipiger sp. PrR004]
MPLNILERRLRLRRDHGAAEGSQNPSLNRHADEAPRRDRSLVRILVLTATCALTAIFYAWLISFFVGFSLGAMAWIGIAFFGALAGYILAIIL